MAGVSFQCVVNDFFFFFPPCEINKLVFVFSLKRGFTVIKTILGLRKKKPFSSLVFLTRKWSHNLKQNDDDDDSKL